MDTMEWLLDSDPAIRWQVMRDLTDSSSEEVQTERDLVPISGWGAELLGLQEADGQWDSGTYRPGWVDDSKPFFDAWTATHYSLQLLHHLGPHPASPEVRNAVKLVRENVKWDVNGGPYFEGETEECINGVALATGSFFGENVDGIVDRLLEDRLDDGGWNCWREYGASVSSFHTTICVLEGLLAWEQQNGPSNEVTSARQAGEKYLLDRHLFRSRATNEVVDPRFTMFSFPYYWYYDVLRALDYFRLSGAEVDERCAYALDLVAGKRDTSGRWRSENRHQGPTHFSVEPSEGDASKWNTLRALRILNWAGA